MRGPCAINQELVTRPHPTGRVVAKRATFPAIIISLPARGRGLEAGLARRLAGAVLGSLGLFGLAAGGFLGAALGLFLGLGGLGALALQAVLRIVRGPGRHAFLFLGRGFARFRGLSAGSARIERPDLAGLFGGAAEQHGARAPHAIAAAELTESAFDIGFQLERNLARHSFA